MSTSPNDPLTGMVSFCRLTYGCILTFNQQSHWADSSIVVQIRCCWSPLPIGQALINTSMASWYSHPGHSPTDPSPQLLCSLSRPSPPPELLEKSWVPASSAFRVLDIPWDLYFDPIKRRGRDVGRKDWIPRPLRYWKADHFLHGRSL